MNTLIYLVVALILGIAVGYLVRRSIGRRQVESAEAKAEEIIRNAKVKQQEAYFKAKEEAIKIIDEAKNEERSRFRELRFAEEKLEKRQSLFEKKLLELEDRQQQVVEKANRLEEVKQKIQKLHEEAVSQLEKIAQMSQEEAKNVLLESVEKKIKDDLLARIKKLEKEGAEEIEKKAKNLITLAVERFAASQVSETTTSSITLPSEEMKGRIIGREGRNIKVLEQLTGTEIIVDDTPETIFISCFNPIRRQLAKRVLEKLIIDGRIQPARIEKFIEEAKIKLAQEIKEAGEEAVYQLGIAGLDPKLIQLLGRLKFRTSYGQNVLQHSVEVANLSAILATELGADVSLSKKAGLLHDIGKAVDSDVEGTHPEIGKDLAQKFGLAEGIIIPIATHHEDHPPTLEAVIVKVADAISGARPGARRDTYEEYLKRLEDLEKIAKEFTGVEKAYAIQAGRELRVFVIPQEIDDLAANKLARQVADRIEEELKYPGEIRVTVIREKRVTEYAR